MRSEIKNILYVYYYVDPSYYISGFRLMIVITNANEIAVSRYHKQVCMYVSQTRKHIV